MSSNDNTSAPAHASELPRFSLRTLLIVFLVAAPVLTLVAMARNASLRHDAKIAQQTKTILAMLDTTAKEVESIRAKLGRAPANEKELEQLMGHPMPIALKSPIQYAQTGPNSFSLAYYIEWLEGFSGDYLVYDSSKPGVGWVSFCN